MLGLAPGRGMGRCRVVLILSTLPLSRRPGRRRREDLTGAASDCKALARAGHLVLGCVRRVAAPTCRRWREHCHRCSQRFRRVKNDRDNRAGGRANGHESTARGRSSGARGVAGDVVPRCNHGIDAWGFQVARARCEVEQQAHSSCVAECSGIIF